MKPFRSLLGLLLLSLAGATGWALLAADPGQVFIRFRGWDIDTSVPYALVLLAVAALLLWLVLAALLMPLRAWRRQRHRLTRGRLVDGLLALHEGRWLRAETLLRRVSTDPRLRLPALLGASRAADARGDAGQADACLAELDADPLRPPERGAVDLAAADRAWAHEDTQSALSRLDAAQARGALSPRALHLRARLLAHLRRHGEACALLPALRASKLLPQPVFTTLEAELHAGALLNAVDPEALSGHWRALSGALRRQPRIVSAYAQRAAALGLEDDAAAAVASALDEAWSEDLALLYGLLPRPRSGSRLAVAEVWLQAHSASPSLLVSLGRLCRDEGLWGKSEDYLHRAIAQGAGSEAWEALGDVLSAEGDDARARMSYANALRVARAEAAQELPGRGLRQQILDQAVAEERDAHGMPRLPLP